MTMRFKSEAMKGNYFKITGISILLLLVVLLAAATFIRYIASDSDEKAPVSETKKQYVCSMHPQVIRDAPGDCPICGMFLIEKIEQDGNSYDSSLTDIVGSVNQSVLSSVMTVTPEQTSLPLVIEATGIINYDPRKIQTISARFGGLIM
jgi:Cu(I)/Ag(I) efflux system membrane fusion protein